MNDRAETSAHYFSRVAQHYEYMARDTNDRYLEMLDHCIYYIRPPAQRILELGCGTGNLTTRLARVNPQAELDLCDKSGELIDLSISRLTGLFKGKLGKLECKFEDLPDIDNKYDLVISSQSIHHVENKLPVYQAIFKSLLPGGQFILCDMFANVDKHAQAQNWQAIRALASLPGKLTIYERDSIFHHCDTEDFYDTVPHSLELLDNVGFVSTDVLWKHWIYAVIAATKPVMP